MMHLVKKLLTIIVISFNVIGVLAQTPTIANAKPWYQRSHRYSYAPNKQIIKDSTRDINFGTERDDASVTTYEYNSKGQMTRKCESWGITTFTYNSFDSLESEVLLVNRPTDEQALDTSHYYKYSYTNGRLSSKEAKNTPLQFFCLDTETPGLERTSYTYKYSHDRLTSVFITNHDLNTREEHDYKYSKGGKITKVVKYKKVGDKDWFIDEVIHYNKKKYDYLVLNKRGKIIRSSKTITNGLETTVERMWYENSFGKVYYNEKGKRVRIVSTDTSKDDVSFYESIFTYDDYGNVLEEFGYTGK